MKTVWIVEDNEADQFIAQKLLEVADKRIAVKIFGNAVAAQQALQKTKKKPWAILLNLEMPVVDGWEFLAWLTERQFNIPVVIITADNRSTSIARAGLIKIVRGYIIKPVNVPDLKMMLNL